MATLQLYGKFGANMMGGEVAGDTFAMDYLSDTIKASLHTTSYTPNIDTDEVFANASSELSTANGYTAGGATLASKTVSYNATGNITTFGSAAITWTASGAGITFRYVVFWDDTVGSDPLIGYLDCTSQTVPAGQVLTIDPTGSGLWTATVT
jgi:hypothetical protein